MCSDMADDASEAAISSCLWYVLLQGVCQFATAWAAGGSLADSTLISIWAVRIVVLCCVCHLQLCLLL